MAKKPNPLLAQFEAQLRAEHRALREAHAETHIIAMIIAANKELKVGPGRAGFFLAEYLDTEMQIAQKLIDDVGDSRKKGGNGDPEFLTTKRDLAAELKRIFGPENWPKYRELFPILKEYW